MTDRAVTAGPWHVEAPDWHDGSYCISNPDGFGLCARNPWPQRSAQSEANAHLIVTAVNACFSLCPHDPQAAAESIPEMVRLIEWRLESKGDTLDFERWKDAARALLARLKEGGE